MREKIMYRVIACIIASMMLLGLSSTSSYAEDITQTEEFLAIMEEREEEYLNSSEHMAEAAKKGISLLDVGNNGQNLSTNVKLIQQTETYNCGPTAALQVLYGMGKQGSVVGVTDKDKISTLMGECYTTSDGTTVSNLTNCMNKYSTNAQYQYQTGRSMTQAEFQSKLETSLCYNIAPILHARTEEFLYYAGKEGGHYIAVSEVDKANGTVRLSDCNWRNEYFGVHVVSVKEAYDSISKYKYDRFLIYMSY